MPQYSATASMTSSKTLSLPRPCCHSLGNLRSASGLPRFASSGHSWKWSVSGFLHLACRFRGHPCRKMDQNSTPWRCWVMSPGHGVLPARLLVRTGHAAPQRWRLFPPLQGWACPLSGRPVLGSPWVDGSQTTRLGSDAAQEGGDGPLAGMAISEIPPKQELSFGLNEKCRGTERLLLVAVTENVKPAQDILHMARGGHFLNSRSL